MFRVRPHEIEEAPRCVASAPWDAPVHAEPDATDLDALDAGPGDPTALLPWMDDLLQFGGGVQPRTETAPLHEAPPTRVADSGPPIPKGARYDPRWTGLASGPVDEGYAPNSVRLPDAVNAGLDEAWRQTTADKRHREHGGNIVRTYGGAYEMRQGGPGLETLYDSDDDDVGMLQDHVGYAHTHPYFGSPHDHAGSAKATSRT